MILPRNGRIVVVDDNFEEALPILSALWQNGFAALYYNGERKDLPSSPLNDIRVIFLDMELIAGGYTDEENKTKAAATANILKSIIDISKNTVYLIIMWATHDELESNFWTYIKSGSNCGFLCLRLDKAKCKANPTIIPDEISSILKTNNTFSFFIKWENIIHKSSNDIILDFSSFFSADTEWDSKILGILKKLAEEYAGKHLDVSDHEKIVKNAMYAFNGTFSDTLENNIAQIPDTGISFNSTTTVSDDAIKGKINSKLMLDQNNVIAKPGSIYANDDHDEIQDYFNSESDLGEIEKIYCEVSPTCDYAQNKWKFHRILAGIKIKPEQKRHVRNADYLYKTPMLDLKGQIFIFVFDLRKLKSKNLGELGTLRPLCTLRHDLLVDIQHKIASHCSRPGIISL